jgi:hypothetical protein
MTMTIDNLSDAVALSRPYSGVPRLPVSEIPAGGSAWFHNELGRVIVIERWHPRDAMYGRVVGVAVSPGDEQIVPTTWSHVAKISDLHVPS